MHSNEDRQADLFPEDYDAPRVFRCLGGAFIGTFNRNAGEDDSPMNRLSANLPSVAAAEQALVAGKWEPPLSEESWAESMTQRAVVKPRGR